MGVLSLVNGRPQELTAAQVTALVGAFTAALSGAVPAAGASTGRFLRDDATFPAGLTYDGARLSTRALTLAPVAGTYGVASDFLLTTAAHTALTASTEYISVKVDGDGAKQFATGAIATQRFAAILAPTYSFVGASTITTAATLAISGAPVAGTNATITSSRALWVQSGQSVFDGNVILGSNSLSFSDSVLARAATGIVRFTNSTSTQTFQVKGSGSQLAFLSMSSSGPIGRVGTSTAATAFYIQCSGTDLVTFDGGTLASSVEAHLLTLDSTSSTTGAATFAGGVGIAKALWVGGTINAAGMATIDRGTGALPATVVTSGLTLAGPDSGGVQGGVESFAWGSGAGFYLAARAATGSRGTPGATAANQYFYRIQSYGHDGTNYVTSSRALLAIQANGEWSATNNGTIFRIYGTAKDSTSQIEWLRVEDAMLAVGQATAPIAGQGAVQVVGLTSTYNAALGSQAPQVTVYGGNTNNRLAIGMDNSGATAVAFLQSWNSSGPAAQDLALNPAGGRVSIGGACDANARLRVTGAGFVTASVGFARTDGGYTGGNFQVGLSDTFQGMTIRAGTSSTDLWGITSAGVMVATGTYGQIYVADGVTAQSIATGTTYSQVTAFNTAQGVDGLSSDTTPAKASSKITATRAGRYAVSFHMSFTCGTNNVVWTAAIFVNGTEQNAVHDRDKFAVGADVASMSAEGIVTVAANQDIDLRIRHDQGGSVSLTPIYASISIRRLGA